MLASTPVRAKVTDDDWLAVRQAKYTAAVQRARDLKSQYDEAMRDVMRKRRLVALAARR